MDGVDGDSAEDCGRWMLTNVRLPRGAGLMALLILSLFLWAGLFLLLDMLVS